MRTKYHNDFTPFLNIMNEWYAKDTSNKIKAIFKSRMKDGMRCSGSIPYGYKRKPDDKQTLIVDEPAAEVVRKIFRLVCQGNSTTAIAEMLTAEKVLIPSAYAALNQPKNCRHKKVKLVAKMLKAIHAQESKKAAREKARAVVEELCSMKLKEAAKKVEDSIEETLTYCDFPSEHWTRIRTNNVIERLNREIRRRTRVVGSFPDGNSALMLVCARLRHVAGSQWGNKKYMNMKHLEAAIEDASIAG